MTERTIALLHGLWMPAGVMWPQKQFLEKDGASRCHLFGYSSVARSLDENADAFAAFLDELPTPATAVVAHSLGGIVALRALSHGGFPDLSHVVCLGSPLVGSRAAEILSRHALGRAVLGTALPHGTLVDPVPEWAGKVTAARLVGVIAGDRPAGLGRFVAGFDEPNDGTVAVAETRLPGIADHIVMPVTHTGMVLSTDVAAQILSFLDRDAFQHDHPASH